ncbi:hypothetical protein F5X98DRAFT_288047 [Xylaria grammica]|nr:hypothetical protein F5X98DRAFT_288047 [Xylaria grammica]
MPACLRSCLFVNVSEETALDINTRFPHVDLEAKSMVILSGLGSPGAAALQTDRTTASAQFGAMAMSVSLPAGAVIVAPTTNPLTTSRLGSRLFATLLSALHFTSYCQWLLGSALLSLLLRASLMASVLFGLSQFASAQTFQATKTLVYRCARLSKQAAWALWDSTRIRRLRKKIEFEFFTLILGAGGNNLCLVIFWPGWGVLGLAALVLSAWYAT